tara:strand:- start:320 stop:676 length:357 start_codon:yes stop_codon:yes gene_type:complete
MKIFFIIYFSLSSILYASNDLNIQCTKEYNHITKQSPIKDSAPTSIDILIKRNSLEKFIWDGQSLEMHFEHKYDDNFDIIILSSGYSDIKNAVFLEIKDNVGYLYQYSQKGVNYKCVK